MINQRAFTLIELMITLLVVAILASVAVPAYQTMVKNNRLTTQVNELVTALLYARSEAVKRSAPVAVCASTDTSSCSGSNTWDTGWIVFIDEDDDLTVDGTDNIIRVHQGLDAGNTIRAFDGGTALSALNYNAEGMSNNRASFRFCDNRGKAEGKVLEVSGTGRPSQSSSPPDACP